MLLNNNQMLSILESMEDPIIVVLKDSTIAYVNLAYSRAFNVPIEKLIGKKLANIEAKARILEVLKNGNPLINDYSYVYSLKKNIYANITPLEENGKLIGAVTIMKDINEILKLQEELEKYKKYSIQLEGQLDKNNFVLLESQVSVMQSAVNIARKVAGSDVTVMLNGESGVGKEIFAKAIHQTSTRKDKPFIPINMASIPENLLESELFGYEEGAFSGSRKGGKKGLMELANEGTLFLDEIGEISMNIQAKLLRVIQEKTFHRLGGTKNYPLNARLICATNRNLYKLINEGKFREDLYYRLNVVPIEIPPLRERLQDIPYIVSNILNSLITKYNKPVTFNDEIYDVFKRYDWPGNIRELTNVLERMIAVSTKSYLVTEDIPETIKRSIHNYQYSSSQVRINVPPSDQDLNKLLESTEKKKLIEVMESSKNRTEAIKKLGISRKAFYSKLKKYGIT
ncbi:MAG TPA: sigma 54-interacting transcriptional regulator [Bacillales bacterium]|nr:sigma 54-interacting transcriptional regulator [Bacillales bacterium]